MLLGMLDQTPVSEGSSGREALENAGLYPGRIDLAIGRASAATARAA